jgi:integrase
VVLQQRALDALRSLPRPLDRTALVLAVPGGEVINLSNFRRRVWQDALEAARLERRPIYEMRHSFATLALAAGAPLEWISKQMGTPRYSGDAPALRAVLARRRRAGAGDA